ncbi:MAG: DUF3006 domain-containing protein [Clostridiaceae bacterium]|nr:DUF3006 domain-containing protein [Clostridiaceae bacterium]
MKLVIDRFEGAFAVCEKEDVTMIDIKRERLPKTAKEGDVLDICRDIITIDIEETKKRRERIEALTKDLWG